MLHDHMTGGRGDAPQGEIPITPAPCWTEVSLSLHAHGTQPLRLRYHGAGLLDLLTLHLA